MEISASSILNRGVENFSDSDLQDFFGIESITRERIGYLLENRTDGFDQLALSLEISKKEVKHVWNELGLGFKRIPRTIPSLKFLRNEGSKEIYEVTEDLPVFLNPMHPLFIPKGTETDLGSVPDFFKFIVDKDEPKFLIPFLVHDLLYLVKIHSRFISDRILYELAGFRGAESYKKYLVHKGVRIGGFLYRSEDEVDYDLRNRMFLLGTEYIAKRKTEIIDTWNRYKLN